MFRAPGVLRGEMVTNAGIRLLTVCGSLQARSSNRAALEVVAAAARAAGATVDDFDRLAEIPPFDPDLDGAPSAVLDDWRSRLAAADAVTRRRARVRRRCRRRRQDAFDWVVGAGSMYRKPVAVISAGTSGGRDARQTLIQTLTWQGGWVVGDVGIAAPRTKSDADGRFTDPDTVAAITELTEHLLTACASAGVRRRRHRRPGGEHVGDRSGARGAGLTPNRTDGRGVSTPDERAAPGSPREGAPHAEGSDNRSTQEETMTTTTMPATTVPATVGRRAPTRSAPSCAPTPRPAPSMVATAEWLADEFAAGAVAHDRDATFATEHLDRLRDDGFLYAPVPSELGGGGVRSIHDVLVAMSRLARGDASTTIGVNMHLAVLLNVVRRGASPSPAARRTQAAGLEAMLRTGDRAPASSSRPRSASRRRRT